MSCPPSRQVGVFRSVDTEEDMDMGSQITGGVDPHLDVHVAAALDERGGLLATASFDATAALHRRLAVGRAWGSSSGDAPSRDAKAGSSLACLQTPATGPGEPGGTARPTSPDPRAQDPDGAPDGLTPRSDAAEPRSPPSVARRERKQPLRTSTNRRTNRYAKRHNISQHCSTPRAAD